MNIPHYDVWRMSLDLRTWRTSGEGGLCVNIPLLTWGALLDQAIAEDAKRMVDLIANYRRKIAAKR